VPNESALASFEDGRFEPVGGHELKGIEVMWVIADCLITPTSMAEDVSNGSVYVTEIFTGRVMRVTLP
jgi:AMMECR1 domain-containing protein